MYDYGALGQHGDHIKSKTIALAHRLFTRNPGFTGEADFVVTKDIRKLDEADGVFFVGSMLMHLRHVAGSPAEQQGLAKKLDKLQ